MLFTFDLARLNAMLKDFYILTQIRITVFDTEFQEITSYPAERAPFCNLIRRDETALHKCIQSDQDACIRASHLHSPLIYQCHAGLTEAIAPIRLGNVLIGYLFFGHILSFDDHEEGWSTIYHLCKTYSVDFNELHLKIQEQPLINTEYILSASHIVESVASYLCLERMITLQSEPLPFQLDRYITEHFSEELNSQILCDHFHISRTQLYHLAKTNYGMGVADHIRNLRIKKAKDLLLDEKNMSITEIAENCGFRDYNYFISTFKRIVGVPPKQFQKEREKNPF